MIDHEPVRTARTEKLKFLVPLTTEPSLKPTPHAAIEFAATVVADQ